MSWPKILTYYTLFALLAGYYLLFEVRPQPQRRVVSLQPRGEKHPFLNLDQEEVQELVVRRPEGQVVCQRDGEGWKVVEPSSARVSPGLVAALVESLVHHREAELMAEAPADLSPFGLDWPSATLVVKTNNRSKPITIFLGDRNPALTACYARIGGSPQVFLLGLTVKYYEELLSEAAGIKGKRLAHEALAP